jgi:predicted DNA-binding transcriptional regulator YafY
LHETQQIVSENDDGVEIAIKVIPNFELEREILGFGENISVISPLKLRKRIEERLLNAIKSYKDEARSILN